MSSQPLNNSTSNSANIPLPSESKLNRRGLALGFFLINCFSCNLSIKASAVGVVLIFFRTSNRQTDIQMNRLDFFFCFVLADSSVSVRCHNASGLVWNLFYFLFSAVNTNIGKVVRERKKGKEKKRKE